MYFCVILLCGVFLFKGRIDLPNPDLRSKRFYIEYLMFPFSVLSMVIILLDSVIRYPSFKKNNIMTMFCTFLNVNECFSAVCTCSIKNSKFSPEKWVNTALRGNNEVEVANYEIITKWILQHRHRQKKETIKYQKRTNKIANK